jgi:cob(I)alamin adenosyltransferase
MSSSSFYTGSGDDGFTGILGEGRVPKYDLRPDAYGTLDEASSALGLARATAELPELMEVVATIQRDLYHMMAEVAATPDQAENFRRIDTARIDWVEKQISEYEQKIKMPKEFVLPGDTLAGAAFDLARTVVRRAERLIARLVHGDQLENELLLVYLNRLSSLCFVLALFANHLGGIDKPSLAKGETT